MLLRLSSIALPGLNGFAGEFLLLLGMFQRGWAQAGSGHWLQLRIIAVLSLDGVVLGAWYMLWMYQRVFFGPVREPHHGPPPSDVSTLAAGNDPRGDSHPPASAAPPVGDLSLREVLTLVPLVVMIFWIGLWPRFFVDRMQPTLDALTAPARAALERQEERGEGRPKARKTVAMKGPVFQAQGPNFKVQLAIELSQIPNLVTMQPNAVNRWNSVILSAAKNLASVAIQARFFAALRMTAFRPLQTIELLPNLKSQISDPKSPNPQIPKSLASAFP